MELKRLTTQIQATLETIAQKCRYGAPQRRSSNSARLTLAGASNNSAAGRILTAPHYPVIETKFPEEILSDRYRQAGWVVRNHASDPDFRIETLAEKTVVFSLRELGGEAVEFRGRLEPISRSGSALFRLAGADQVFNLNLCGFMAVEPVAG